MRTVIRENGATLGDRIIIADTFFRRLKGLMLTKQLPGGHGLLIRPCKSVHTYFMKYNIDVLHLDEAGKIVGMELSLKPGRMGAVIRGTQSVLELPEGTLGQAGAQVGQTVIFEN